MFLATGTDCRAPGCACQSGESAGHLFRKSLDEVLDQDRNVFPALSQRRHVDRKNVQPVKEIRSE